ncbi:MAG: Transcriptional regulator HosA [Verrucomicrobia subdivision 3 bacterium]|nr:Transcriptional regulator HosA [Limisphaerales bacterium]MCS1413630.1 Transcriptional regulator HosA [Limisphaerales bacterium]
MTDDSYPILDERLEEPIDAPTRRRLPPLLRRSWYGLNQAFRRRITHLELTPDQFTVMRSLLEGDPEGMTQRQLTETISSDPNTIASLLERMERAGFLERKPHEKDRRAHRILPLEKGRTTYEQARDIAVQLQSEVLGALPEEKREAFLESLTLIADACRQAVESSPRKARAPSE